MAYGKCSGSWSTCPGGTFGRPESTRKLLHATERREEEGASHGFKGVWGPVEHKQHRAGYHTSTGTCVTDGAMQAEWRDSVRVTLPHMSTGGEEPLPLVPCNPGTRMERVGDNGGTQNAQATQKRLQTLSKEKRNWSSQDKPSTLASCD